MIDNSRARLDRDAFNQPTLRVARDLLGTFIVHKVVGGPAHAMIAEVEAYRGPADRASHARGGRRTPRVEPLYRDGGTSYVYLVYGLHWLLNFSTVGPDIPEGVLIRGIVVQGDGAPHLVSGPGNVTRYLRVDKRQDGVDVTRSDELWLERRGIRVPPRFVRSGPRIGIDYAGPYWAARPWRFWIDAEFLRADAFTGARRESRVDTRRAPPRRTRPASTA